MRPLPMPFSGYQERLHASWQKQLSRGLAPYVLKNGLIGLFLYSAVLAIFLFFRGRPYVSSRTSTYWIAMGIILVGVTFGQAVLNFYTLKRRVARHL